MLPTHLMSLSICFCYPLTQFIFLCRIKITQVNSLQESLTEDFLHYSRLIETVACSRATV